MRAILYRTHKTSMLLKVSIGFFLGILFGFIAAPMMPYSPVLKNYVMPFLELSGKIFLRLLTMIIVPLVFASLISGISSVGDVRKLGRIGGKTIALYLTTTLIAVCIGIFCAELFKPGTSIDVPVGVHEYTRTTKAMSEAILDIFPVNPIASMVNADMLQIIVFAVFCGIACIFSGETGEKISEFFNKMAELMHSITRIVMYFAPYGVFALISTSAADFGLKLIAPFAKIIAAVYSACTLQALIVYSLMIIIFCRKSPLWFFRGIHEAALTAFATRSSSVTLPVTIENARIKLGISDEVSSFALPLGATINMDGTAIYQVVAALFVARAFNVPIDHQLLTKIFVASTIASIGAAGIPGAGIVMLTMVLSSAGLPVEGIGLVAGIEVVLSSASTCLNVVGDAAVCAVVASTEGENLTLNSSRDRMPALNGA